MFYLKWLRRSSSPPPPPPVTIMDMPDLVLRKILENVDFISIIKLQKVCHAFRNFIHETKPDNNLNEININVEADKIFVYLEYSSEHCSTKTFIEIEYRKHEKGCEVVRNYYTEDKATIIRKNFIDTFTDNMRPILMNHKKLLDHFEIMTYNSSQDERKTMNVEKVIDFVEKVLKSRKKAIQTKSLDLSISVQTQLAQVLELIDAEKLKSLRILHVTNTEEIMPGNMKIPIDFEVSRNWSEFINLECLAVSNFVITSPFHLFHHVTDLFVAFRSIICADIYHVKYKLLKTKTDLYSNIFYEEFIDKSRLASILGPRRYIREMWDFEVPDTDDRLRVDFSTPNNVIFY